MSGHSSRVNANPATVHAMRKRTRYVRIILELLHDGQECKTDQKTGGDDRTEDEDVCHGSIIPE
jgi:hypothetical protein